MADENKKTLDDTGSDIQIENIAKNVLKTKKEDAAEKKDAAAVPIKKIIKFGKNYEIHADKPLASLSSSITQAFKAVDTTNPSKQIYAILCHDVFPPRRRAYKAFETITNKCMAELLATGVVNWEPEGRYRYAIIFDNIYGQPAMKNIKGKQEPLSEDKLVNMVIKPITTLLRNFKEKNFVHGSIRPDMLFENVLDGGKSYALAPALSMPLAFDQPVLYETVERGMAQSSGRGLGSSSTDLYALGVTLAVLLIGYNPLGKRTDHEIIRAKVEYGTFSSLLGNQRIPQGINEVLRGLLQDDPKARWDIEDLEKWVEGRRMSPRQSNKEPKAARSFEFINEKYSSLRLLAKALTENSSEAIKVLEAGLLKRWIERSLGDRAVIERFEHATEGYISGDNKDQLYGENIIAKISMALDPGAPIRYRGVSVMPDGVGLALTEAVAYQKNVDVYTDIIQHELIPFWFSCQRDSAVDVVTQMGLMEACKGFLRNKKIPGNGVERCVYYLNKEASCLSPHFQNYDVHDPITFIMALEVIAGQSDRPKEVFDQHMAAFLSTHFSAANEGDIQLLGAYDLKIKYKAMLTLFSGLQAYAEIPKMPNLAKWMMTMIEPVVNNYNSRALRQKIQADLEGLANEGDLVGMRDLLENNTLMKEDIMGFSKAKLEFKKLEEEYFKTEIDLSRDSMGLAQGREVAGIVCALLAVLGLFGFLAMHFGMM